MKFISDVFKRYMKSNYNQVPPNQDSNPFIGVFTTIDENISFLKDTFSGSDDLKIKEFKVRNNRGVLVFLNTMADKDNCDAFGIGRRLIAFHPETWKMQDQKDYFQKIKFNMAVKVEVIKHGIVM